MVGARFEALLEPLSWQANKLNLPLAYVGLTCPSEVLIERRSSNLLYRRQHVVAANMYCRSVELALRMSGLVLKGCRAMM